MAPIIALAGATGKFGSKVANVALDTAEKFAEVRVLSRTTSLSSDANKALSARGAKIYGIDLQQADTITTALKGVQILIITMGTKNNGLQSEEILIEAAAKVGVQRVIPSEWGMDHRDVQPTNDLFKHKSKITQMINDLGMSYTVLYNPLLMEESFGPWFGLDTKKGIWKMIGDPNQHFTTTSYTDMAKAGISAALRHDLANKHLRINGDNVSINTIKSWFELAYNVKINIETTPTEDTLAKIKAGDAFFEDNLMYYRAHAESNFEHDNANELVNPGESLWNWTKLKDFVGTKQLVIDHE